MLHARKILVPGILIALSLVTTQVVVAQLVVYDDLEDGDIGRFNAEGFYIPKCNGGPGTLELNAGDLVIEAGSWTKWCLNAFNRDGIRSGIRSNPDWSFRVDVTSVSGTFAIGKSDLTHGLIQPTIGILQAGKGRVGGNELEIDFDLDERLLLQADIFDDSVNAYLWREGSPESLRNVTFTVANAGGSQPAFGVQDGGLATIHQMWVSTSPIPISFVAGDFNADTHFDMTDINQLTEAMQTGDSRFNLNDDNVVNNDDRLIWVHQIKNTWFGDSNLDGEFSSEDFVEVFQAGKYETGQLAGWQEGDWDGDGVFSSGDFVTAFQDGGFERGPRADIQSVPEPSSIFFALTGLIAFTRFRSRLGS